MSPLPNLTWSTHGRVKSRGLFHYRPHLKYPPPFLKQGHRSAQDLTSWPASQPILHTNLLDTVPWIFSWNWFIFRSSNICQIWKLFCLNFGKGGAETYFHLLFLIKLVSLLIAVCLFLVLMILPGVRCVLIIEKGAFPSSPPPAQCLAFKC